MGFLTTVDIERIDDEPQYTLGDIMPSENKQEQFMYVKYNAGSHTVTAVKGYVAYLVLAGTSSPGPWEVSADAASATTYVTSVTTAIAFFCSALSAGKYGWVQISGYNLYAMLTDTSVTAGSRLMADVAATGRVKNLADAAPPPEILAIALTDDATAALAVGHAIICSRIPKR